jgi:glycerol-3-phosphate dehydrogenase (NAD(P)+)
MARGAREVSRLVKAMGGEEITVYGLSHLGDYEATLFSPHSHNRRFGEAIVRGEPYDDLAEGVGTAAALRRIADDLSVDLPISCAVHAVVADGRDPREVLDELFGRPLRREFDETR